MALYVYKISTGALVSWSPNDDAQVASDAELASKGLAKVVGLTALDSTHAWDAPTHSVVVVAAPTLIRVMNVFDWMDRFTPAELVAIRASANAGVQKFVFMLPLAASVGVDINSGRMQTVMALLVNQGLITQARSDAIMS